MASDAAPQQTNVAQPVRAKKVGLLFVHGIGEQTRWEHLRNSVSELVDLLRMHGTPGVSVSVIDRTDGWNIPAGEPSIERDAPITVSLRPRDGITCAIDFECHEVWWSDLGIRLTLFESIRFWIWGLGQWAAPVYIDLDASGLATQTTERELSATRASRRPQVGMPKSIAAQLGYQMLARFNLAWAALVAVLTVLSLSLFKRVAGSVGQIDTAPSLLVQYIGDVQVYEQRAQPGKGLVSDPGHPKRVGIRRRMISEMVAMGAREYDHWYILAHSLGTVVAFNGIGEIGHTLPNYLPKKLWDDLPVRLRTNPNGARREDIEAMMPSRPTWLADDDCINRPELFDKLRGFVTYGSPLDKFAALWPRIVAFETDDGPRRVFPNCAWVNIVTDTDPVAGAIDRYDAAKEGSGKDLPRLHNVKRPGLQLIGLSHVQYWQVPERWNTSTADYYQAAFSWLTGGGGLQQNTSSEPASDQHEPPFGKSYKPGLANHSTLVFQALMLTGLLWAATTVIIGTVLAQFVPIEWSHYGEDAAMPTWLGHYAPFFLQLMPGVAAAASLIIYLAGHLRWISETIFNRRLARHDHAKDGRLGPFISLATVQIAAGVISLLAGAGAISLAWSQCVTENFELGRTGLIFAGLMLGLIVLAALLQSAINKLLSTNGESKPAQEETT